MKKVIYVIKRRFDEAEKAEYNTSNLANALDVTLSDDWLYRKKGGRSLSICKIVNGKEVGRIFEQNNLGHCIIDIDSCATTEEVIIIHDVIRAFA